MKKGAYIVSYIWPAENSELLDDLASKGATVFAIDSLPRISRAQKMDALSAMANISGYRAVIEAASCFGRFFTGQVTAAGKVPPAKIMVIGAGVAGLAAVGTANSMGAIVRAFDTRLEVKEQVESMGAQFLELDFSDEEGGGGAAMVESMKSGSVVVDLASERGGNCELTEPGKIVEKHGVTLIGHTDLPSRMAKVSSDLYSSNLVHLLSDLTPEKNGKPNVDMDDVVIRGVTVVKDKKITWPPPKVEVSAPPASKLSEEAKEVVVKEPTFLDKWLGKGTLLALTLAVLFGVGGYAPESFLSHFTVFVLSCFIGYQVVWNVTASLHTPLMSVTNAISGIIVTGARLHLVAADDGSAGIMSFIAVLIATINIAGGFKVTHRMLNMFRK